MEEFYAAWTDLNLISHLVLDGCIICLKPDLAKLFQFDKHDNAKGCRDMCITPQRTFTETAGVSVELD